MSRGPSSSESDDGARNDIAAPPPHTRTVTALRWLMLAALAALAVAGVARAAAHRQKNAADTAAGKPADAATKIFACPMHPEVVGEASGTCPVCNMALVPRRAGARLGGAALIRAREAGLATVVVSKAALAPTLEIPATIAPQERSVVQVTGRYAGWIETVAVLEAGRHVERGQILLTVNSPDLQRAQKMLLNARSWSQNGEVIAVPSHEGDSTNDVMGEARFRVESFGVDPRDIATIIKTGFMRAVPIRAPSSGVVIRKDAVPGGYVQPGAPLFTIADLRNVSVLGDLPEADLRHVRAGQEVAVVVRAFPGESFSGKVIFVAPVLEGPGSSARLRVDLPNPGLRLRPGSSATLRIKVPQRQALTVPPTSLVTLAAGTFVFVEFPDGFARRPVTVGARTTDAVEIISGLVAGQRVAAAGTILLEAADSASANVAGAPP
ncbi:MAG TPA: efflux RND transporter periplasmic adaptor subunit [Polyangia bacterium]|jgi:Cu(I)/Ag(I) efflux system membrane fusion protein|nr:efflux RND transporter periplasmic adaptor subunit [Polyangia bacterium]